MIAFHMLYSAIDHQEDSAGENADDQPCKCASQCACEPRQIPIWIQRCGSTANCGQYKNGDSNKLRLENIVALSYVQSDDRVRNDIVDISAGSIRRRVESRLLCF